VRGDYGLAKPAKPLGTLGSHSPSIRTLTGANERYSAAPGLPIGSDRAAGRHEKTTSARAWLNNSTNARAANTFVPAAGNVGKDAYNSGDTRVGRGGDNIGHTRF
jgi:hypothetical protein